MKDQTERRRRNSDGLAGRRMRLQVDEAALDRTKFAYRWINDEGSRVEDLTVRDDWEIVQDRPGSVRADGIGMGAEAAIPAGVNRDGKPMRAVLVRKPLDYHREDEAAKARAIDETEAGMRRGQVPGAGGEIKSEMLISRE